MSLLNPIVWIGLLVSLTASFGFGYYKGGMDEFLKQQAEIARLNDEARQKEQALVTAVQTQATQLVKAEQNAKLLSQKRNTDIDTGALKLRIPVKTPICPIQTTTDATPSERSDIGGAEIQPETAKAILAIGDEADTTVRKLNACIAVYNQVREMLNQKGNP
jgi:ATPase subunit of ABC transporter with duplicated ATPase domains